MAVREYISQVIESLSEPELEKVAEYLAFLKFQARLSIAPYSKQMETEALYYKFAEEDRMMAEEGMADYYTGLANEDTQ